MLRHARSLLPLLVAAALAAPVAAQTSPQASDSAATAGFEEGRTAASAVSTTVWALSGFGGSALLGPIGASLTVALASSSGSALPQAVLTRNAKKDPSYQIAYQQAYTEWLTRRRRSSALVGGIAGTALLLTGGLGYLVLN